MKLEVLKVVKWFAITMVVGIVGSVLIMAGVVATHSFTNEPQQFYEINQEFEFEFIEGDPTLIKITGIEYNDVLDELWIHIQVRNLDDDTYIDSPYQFKVQDENNKVFVPIVKNVGYNAFDIDEIGAGGILAKTFAYKINNPELKHTLIINEYLGNGAVGIELFN